MRNSNQPSRDPAIDEVVQEMRARRDLSLNRISQRSGVSVGTLSRLDSGITRFPHHHTLARIWQGLGYAFRPVPTGGDD